MFAAVGFAAGLVGTAMSNGLLAARKALDPDFRSQNQAPDVALNAATWAAHMGVSSNLRYQILNGLDMARAPKKTPALTCRGVLLSGTSVGCGVKKKPVTHIQWAYSGLGPRMGAPSGAAARGPA